MKREIIPAARIAQSIHWLREEKIRLDSDLAQLHGVTTGNLNKGVKRNHDRFPADFMFQLTAEQAEPLIFQIGISKDRGGRRHLRYAFTEQGGAIIDAIRQLMTPPKKPAREIGFHVREMAPRYLTGRVGALRRPDAAARRPYPRSRNQRHD